MTFVARRPSQALVDLVGTLGGTWHGYMAMCRCPAHADNTPSLSIRQGDRGLLVTCFAGCDPVDILRELARIPLGRAFQPPRNAPERTTANIERLWSEAGPVSGTLGERYLASRCLLPIPEDLRFHPRCPRGPKPRTVFKPALLVAIREGHKLVAFQRIFLDPATAAYTEKAALGTGGSGTWLGGQPGATMGLAESFEDAHAWSLIRGLPCRATFGARRFDLVSIPEAVTTLLLAGDNDAAGRAAVSRATRRYASDKRIIKVDLPCTHKDWAAAHEAQQRRGGGER